MIRETSITPASIIYWRACAIALYNFPSSYITLATQFSWWGRPCYSAICTAFIEHACLNDYVETRVHLLKWWWGWLLSRDVLLTGLTWYSAYIDWLLYINVISCQCFQCNENKSLYGEYKVEYTGLQHGIWVSLDPIFCPYICRGT